jgi:hypothetical protein
MGEEAKRSKLAQGLVVMIAIPVMCCLGTMMFGGSARQSSTGPGPAAAVARPTGADQAPSASVPPLDIDARKLAAAYEENEVAADDKYKGRSLRVAGTVQAISKDFMGDVYVQLASQNEFMPTNAYVEKSQRAAAAGLKKGQRITVLCTGDGLIVASPILRACTIAQ